MSDTTPVGTAGGNPFALLALSDKFSDRTRRVLMAYAAGMTAWRVGKAWYDKGQAARKYSVAVNGNDEIYTDLHTWLLRRLPKSKQRAVTAVSVSLKSDDYDEDTCEPGSDSDGLPGGLNRSARRRLKILYDGTRTQQVTVDGHRISVELERPEWSRDDHENRFVRQLERIIFTADSLAGKDAVLGFLAAVAAEQKKRKPRVYTVDRWQSGWDKTTDLPPRPLDTVVLREGQQERLVDDLRRFLSFEKDYALYGVPWHRGYLFHGPAGTGKTSLARALAGRFNLDVYYMPLTGIKDDPTLNGLFGSVNARSVLLLEDVDVVHGTHVRTDDQPGVTLQGLLNALDGFATPHGLVTIMTTNCLDVLDTRLIRPGRIDMFEEIGFLDEEQLGRLLRVFLGEKAPRLLFEGKRSPADVVDVLKQHIDDPDAAVRALEEKFA